MSAVIDWAQQDAGFASVRRALARMRQSGPEPYAFRWAAELTAAADAWLLRWDTASPEEREQMRAETLTDELKAAIRQQRKRQHEGGAR